MPKNDTSHSVLMEGRIYAPGEELPRALKQPKTVKKPTETKQLEATREAKVPADGAGGVG